MTCSQRGSQWTETVSRHLPHLSRPQAVVVAFWSLGMVLTGSCGWSQVSAMLALLVAQREETLRQRLREWYSLADRGLYAPWLYRQIVAQGWHPHLAHQGGSQSLPAGQRPLAMAHPTLCLPQQSSGQSGWPVLPTRRTGWTARGFCAESQARSRFCAPLATRRSRSIGSGPNM
jgi:hypothetical protein